MAFYLIRHGETEWNHSKKIQGWKDVDLNDRGLLQAEKLAIFLKNHKIDYIYASDLKRAYKTSLIFSQHVHHEIISDPFLREINFGDWEGKTWKEIQHEYHEFFESGGLNQLDLAVHHGESLISFKKRVVDHFLDLVKRHPDEEVFIFTHGGNIKMILVELLNIPLQADNSLAIDNASITIIKRNSLSNQLEVLSSNDTSHLSEVK
jgi:phosphoserine phosphatase